ncbi:hypothetical protein [Pontiella sulfatireligans]|uniref:Uncharacterized protein n=1 Tax=Pontiella sulfatireligans TaxID=2750658 RepID=A0A6C2URT5_9BACT|nr:hypothetical protein [Pontiella sulfatireligans]VGO22968.1 hypothetical protein SCARR_05067 [Pontiella sulfatireligans]
MPRAIGKTNLSSAGLGSIFSYELCGDQIVSRLFGLFPVRSINLAAVCYLRLATRSEVSPVYFLTSWMQFMPHRRTINPVYVLQTRKGHRLFLKLQGDAHFKLRQAIGRFQANGKHRMAA